MCLAGRMIFQGSAQTNLLFSDPQQRSCHVIFWMLQEIPTAVCFQSKRLLRTGLCLCTGMEKNDTHPPFAWELDLSFCGYGFGRKTSESKENDDTSYMERNSLGMLILLIPVLGYPLKNVIGGSCLLLFACRLLNSQREELKINFRSSQGTVLPTSTEDNTLYVVSVCRLWGFSPEWITRDTWLPGEGCVDPLLLEQRSPCPSEAHLQAGPPD